MTEMQHCTQIKTHLAVRTQWYYSQINASLKSSAFVIRCGALRTASTFTAKNNYTW